MRLKDVHSPWSADLEAALLSQSGLSLLWHAERASQSMREKVFTVTGTRMGNLA